MAFDTLAFGMGEWVIWFIWHFICRYPKSDKVIFFFLLYANKTPCSNIGGARGNVVEAARDGGSEIWLFSLLAITEIVLKSGLEVFRGVPMCSEVF